jgi:hypothetical protein
MIQRILSLTLDSIRAVSLHHSPSIGLRKGRKGYMEWLESRSGLASALPVEAMEAVEIEKGRQSGLFLFPVRETRFTWPS